MDANRFDALSRDLARATDRRTVVRGAAGGGFFAMLGLVFGRGRRAAAADKPVTCTWEIEARGSSGPNRSGSYNGILSVTIEPNGAIDKGNYVLVDGSWQPLVDSHGNQIVFDVVGSTHLRSIDFRAEHDGCDELAFTGVNRYLVTECKGPMSGSFQGPELTDLGGWRTHRTEICTPCRGAQCPPKTYLDAATCECIPTCPGGYKVCKDVVCVPEVCPTGTVYDEQRCVCACEPKECNSDELWCPYACACIPCKQCQKQDCPDGYVHYLTGDDLCTCVKDPCHKKVTCAKGETLIYDGVTCKCIGEQCCKERTCDQGSRWDKTTCSCQPECVKRDCDSGYTWNDAKCDCVPTSCPPTDCPNPNYTVDPQTCQCVCQTQTCQGSLKWDPNNCVCFCPDTLVCQDGYTLDPATCNCVPGNCIEQSCDQGYEWDPNACTCVCSPQECGNSRQWDTDTCQCVCIPTLACRKPEVYDPELCMCVCGITDCDPGSTLDPVKCVCNPTSNCSTAPACDAGLVQDPLTCACLCPDGKPLCDANCNDQSSDNCGACGNRCKYGCCQGLCCVG